MSQTVQSESFRGIAAVTVCVCVGGGAQRSGYTSFIVRGDVLSFCVTS